MSPEPSTLLKENEDIFKKSPERHEFSLNGDQWRSAIGAALSTIPAANLVPLQSDRTLGSGMDLGDGFPVQDAQDIHLLTAAIADQANSLLSEAVWTPRRIEHYLIYYVNLETRERFVLLGDLERIMQLNHISNS